MIPIHATTLSAGADLVSTKDIVILPKETQLIPTGTYVPDNMPKNSFFMLVPRSSICMKRGLIQPNSVGIIDADYPNEIFAAFMNIGNKPVIIKKGERIAQLICMPFLQVFPVDDVQRTGGFGSTNKQKDK